MSPKIMILALCVFLAIGCSEKSSNNNASTDSDVKKVDTNVEPVIEENTAAVENNTNAKATPTMLVLEVEGMT
ncbi:hypothetical protein [Candidatus Uabimicrobium sp. HlEnr_7]|uniref:hypothetical protein n=1 Tax=Candidatus Uabimicrobium helgolandensis TaxID=3095367 RepID=UPI0035569E94